MRNSLRPRSKGCRKEPDRHRGDLDTALEVKSDNFAIGPAGSGALVSSFPVQVFLAIRLLADILNAHLQTRGFGKH